ncbi:hypothetical protein KRR55_10475 [Paeniglutamicibacter sp. ABSL32-1]|uniref:hypothetical protein n=1 Tax=Paeniglutamicibacter quisquiliarum TaxID=2849498 RepID=UPI001C2CC962|nr:hypothetical protein [Paeniglutamicibacter quisquiliarum]MBV1779535.1 hypothetical protein [Paeniglutamicibacter quisquiliarum]
MYSVLAAFAAGALAAVVGTILHASISYAGDVPIPWGAALALLLTGALTYWVGLLRGKLWVSALAGLATYVFVALIATDSNNQMIVSTQYFELLPGPALAGGIWVYGIIVPVIVAILLASRHLRNAARSRG